MVSPAWTRVPTGAATDEADGRVDRVVDPIAAGAEAAPPRGPPLPRASRRQIRPALAFTMSRSGAGGQARVVVDDPGIAALVR